MSLLFLGFAAGLPLLLVFGTLSFWLREAGVSRSSIGFASWILLAYSLKFVWAPLLDSVRPPRLLRGLGRRRGWMLVAQIGVMSGLLGMAFTDPQLHLHTLIGFAVFTAFASSTQDVVIDAYRIECAPQEEQAALAATYQLGYRIGMIAAGAGALVLADQFAGASLVEHYDYMAWRYTYACMAMLMLVAVLTTLMIAAPINTATLYAGPRRSVPQWFEDVVWAPVLEFMNRYGKLAVVILALIATYRISDLVLGVITNVFYQDLGFTKTQVGLVSKGYGLVMTLVGAFVGGALAPKIGATRLLLLGAVLVAATNLLFAWLSGQAPTTQVLIMVISADNFSGGLATTGFLAYLSGLTSVQFSATQYAVFSSLMSVIPKILGGFSGSFVDHTSYPTFFIVCALLGLPAIGLILWLRRLTGDAPDQLVTQSAQAADGDAAANKDASISGRSS